MIVPVILAGGSGERLWPLSRSLHPKQFLNLSGESSLLQTTYKRIKQLDLKLHDSIVVCSQDHRFIVAEQLKDDLPNIDILLEPESKSTAPAIALAAFHAIQKNENATLLVVPSDHNIDDLNSFRSSTKKAVQIALAESLVTFGIVAKTPHTGFGYIKKGVELDETACYVDQFIEKPCHDKALEYIQSGDYFWNSGMFVFKAKRYIELLQRFEPEIFHACQKSINMASKDLDFIRVETKSFRESPSKSIDYAVMEPITRSKHSSDSVVMVPLDSNWSDIGTWSALWEMREKDQQGNCIIGDAIYKDTTNCMVHANAKLVALLGVDNLVVVDTKDALLVANMNKDQEVKQIVEKLKSSNRDEWEVSREVYRPWGNFDTLEQGLGYKVKKITVQTGASLSLQKHLKRAEHWVVVSGVAKVTRENDVFYVRENESTYIPIGAIHALENSGDEVLELIEVQTGDILNEEDIIRYKDNYGRQ